jgi:catechol 2,3-dioxygenase-like lactoylglutathione lyase family enzyme/regulation of enolase protein 1 (concanavalin A-like superfamily)
MTTKKMMRRLFVLLAISCLYRVPALAGQQPLLGLARVSIRVNDLNQARAFYTGVVGLDEAFDAKNPDGSVAAAYFKVNDEQFLEILPGLTPKDMRPMTGFAIRTDQLEKLRAELAAAGLNPGKIQVDADGSRGFELRSLPGQDIDFLEFVQYGPKSLAVRTRGQFLGPHRLSTHLEHVGIIATDFDAAYAFYVKTLGFHEMWRRVTTDQSKVVIDHIAMNGPESDFVELSNQSDRQTPLTRQRAGTAAHMAFTVPDVKAAQAAVHTLDAGLRQTQPRYGLDNRWNYNLFDPDGTRVELMQVADPAHPAPAVAVTPADFGQAANALGIFESQSDVGNPALVGSASFDSAQKQYTVSGAGANMWAGKDEFHFVWRRISGDFSLTATVHFPKQEPPSHRKAALMARESLDDGAAYADAVVHGSGLTELQFRDAAGAATHSIRFPVDAPARIRLERKQGWFTMYAGAEGQPLKELGAYMMKLTDPIYLGLAVCSHNAAAIETAVFSDVVFTEIPKDEEKTGQQ